MEKLAQRTIPVQTFERCELSEIQKGIDIYTVFFFTAAYPSMENCGRLFQVEGLETNFYATMGRLHC